MPESVVLSKRGGARKGPRSKPVRHGDGDPLRVKLRRFRLPKPSLAAMAWRGNAATLGAASVIGTVALVEQTSWGSMATTVSILAFLGSGLVYRIAHLQSRELRP